MEKKSDFEVLIELWEKLTRNQDENPRRTNGKSHPRRGQGPPGRKRKFKITKGAR